VAVTSLVLLHQTLTKLWRESPSNYTCWWGVKNPSQFSTNILLIVGNDTAYTDSYCGTLIGSPICYMRWCYISNDVEWSLMVTSPIVNLSDANVTRNRPTEKCHFYANSASGCRAWCLCQASEAIFGLGWPWPLTSWPSMYDLFKFTSKSVLSFSKYCVQMVLAERTERLITWAYKSGMLEALQMSWVHCELFLLLYSS